MDLPTTPCIMIPIDQRATNGYAWVWITEDGRRQRVYVHRRIMERALGRRLGRHEEVMHLCDNPPCFRFDHLVVGTHAENIGMAAERGTFAGERNGRAKLTEEEVAEIRRRPGSIRSLAREFGVSDAQISRIRTGKAWR